MIVIHTSNRPRISLTEKSAIRFGLFWREICLFRCWWCVSLKVFNVIVDIRTVQHIQMHCIWSDCNLCIQLLKYIAYGALALRPLCTKSSFAGECERVEKGWRKEKESEWERSREREVATEWFPRIWTLSSGKQMYTEPSLLYIYCNHIFIQFILLRILSPSVIQLLFCFTMYLNYTVHLCTFHDIKV